MGQLNTIYFIKEYSMLICKRSITFLPILIFLILSKPHNTLANSIQSRTWSGQIDNISTWITVISHDPTGEINNNSNNNWWMWGNTKTDTYLFAFESPDNVRLILSFDKDSTNNDEAKIFVNELGKEKIDYKMEGQDIRILSNNGLPYLIIKANQNEWIENGITNFNLEILVDGPLSFALNEPYPKVATDGIVDWKIQTHADQPGIPDWQVVSVENDPAPSRSYQRFTLSKRMEESPEYKVTRALMPGFPYLGILSKSGNYFVENNPPFYYDLSKEELVFFGFTGFQSGSYVINSSEMPPNVDFESPFAWYNLSNNSRYPQLVIRGWYYPANDPLIEGFRPKIPALSTFRYSWKTSDEQKWAYSIQVAGPYAYTDQVKIGEVSFWGVPEDRLPAWIISKKWPITTFVEATNGVLGEGIYYYSPQTTDILKYFIGLTDHIPSYFETPVLQEITRLENYYSLPKDFRGEYQLNKGTKPTLYFSPVDNCLHLQYANGGYWYLGNGNLIHYLNLNDDQTIDAWFTEHFELPADLDDAYDLPKTKINDRLYQLDNYFLYSSEGNVQIIKSDFSKSIGNYSPPIDQKSWESFNKTIESLPKKRDPTNLASWLNDFGIDRTIISHADISNVRINSDGFSFILEVSEDSSFRNEGNSSFQNLSTGKYTVIYNSGKFTINAVKPNIVEISKITMVNPPNLRFVYQPILISVTLNNIGNEDSYPVTVNIWDQYHDNSERLVGEQNTVIPSGHSQTLTFNLIFQNVGFHQLQINLSGVDIDQSIITDSQLNVTVMAVDTPWLARILPLSGQARPALLLAFLAAFALSAVALALALASHKGA